MTTTSFKRLDAYLTRDFNPDYWYDDACRLAMQWIAEFAPVDWAALRAHAPHRPPEWQGRCAYALIGAAAIDGADLLLQIAGCDDDDTAWTAVAALKSLSWDGLHPMLTPALDKRLRQLVLARPMASDAIDWLRQSAPRVGFNSR